MGFWDRMQIFMFIRQAFYQVLEKVEKHRIPCAYCMLCLPTVYTAL